MNVNIGANIRRIRKERGYRSAAELGGALTAWGYTCAPSTVKSWEQGRRAPTLNAIVALCIVLEVSADALIFGAERDILILRK